MISMGLHSARPYLTQVFLWSLGRKTSGDMRLLPCASVSYNKLNAKKNSRTLPAVGRLGNYNFTCQIQEFAICPGDGNEENHS
jgi:hypothetical protein